MLRLLRIWRLRLRSLVRRDAVDAELHRELIFHFDQLVAEHTATGRSLEDARRDARHALGHVAALEDYCRDQRRVTWIHDLRQDVGFGWRILRAQPGFTTIAMASLAIGIGANAAVLGAIDALLVDGVQVPHADRLVAIQRVPLDNPSQLGGSSLADYAAFRDRSQSFDSIDIGIRWSGDLASDEPGQPPERIFGQLVTPGWLTALDLGPLLGRVFTEAESRPGSVAPVIVISQGFWQRRLGADPAVLNRQIRVQGAWRTVIGVMPAEFRYQEPGIDYWLPLAVGAQPEAGARLFGVRARLKPGVSVDHAQAELDVIAAQMAVDNPTLDKGLGVRVRPLNEFLFGWTREPLLTIEAAVALVLLIACANVAALLLSRASVRQREVALRAALGASRGRLIRQLLTESLLLAAGGGALGLAVAVLGQRTLVAMTTPPASPPLTAIAMNTHVIGVLACLTVLTGLACGVVPAIRGSQPNPIGSLKEPFPAAAPARAAWPRGALVSAQLAFALILLAGSGLLVNSFIRLVNRDLGFDTADLVRVDYGMPAGRYAQRIGSYRGFPYFDIGPLPSQSIAAVLDRLRALPNVEAVGGISAPPVDSFVLTSMDVVVEGAAGPVKPSAAYFLVTPDLFATLRAPIVRGRDFSARDTAATPWVAIVNETCARRLWPGEDPIGKRLTLDTVPEEQAREVVGVVRDIPLRHAEPPQPVIYASYLQQPSRYRGPWAGLFGQMLFMIRPAGDPQAVIAAARHVVAEVDPDRPLVDADTVRAHMHNAVGKFRYFVLLVGVFAGTAMLLAAIGTYGVMAYSVSQRTREIGIRRALGASRRDIVALVGRRAVVLIGVGLAAGLAGALALTRLIASQLWGVTPTDPPTFAGVSCLLAGVALVACLVPARRALAVDPTVALRSE